MNITDLFHPNQIFLTEANILNTKDPHDGHSIQAYLKQYTDAIKSQAAKKMFVKKIQKFLLNDPKYHYAVQSLPNNAPDWAKEAHRARDLYFFKPNEQLNNTIEHLTHYIAKMEEDMDGNDANKKALAAREFAGFPKAETLDILIQKSDEYFARGAGQASTLEGTTVVMKTGQFTWLKLETADSFREAGETIQNCIGSIWTKAKTDNAGQSIIVLANRKNDLIVAARIKNADNELQEMKGKNNLAPINEYMPPVVAMINKFKLSLSSGAMHDLVEAGYYWDEENKVLLTKPQAIKKLVAVNVLGSMSSGLKLVEAKPRNDNKTSLFIFAEIYFDSSYGQVEKGVTVYEARTENGNPVISGHVKGNKLIRMNTFFNTRLHEISPIQETVDTNNNKNSVKSYVTELLQRKIIKDIDRPILQAMYWNFGLEFDDQSGKIVDKIEGNRKQLDKKDHEWRKYTERSSIRTIMNSIGEREEELSGLKEPVKKAFTAIEEKSTDRTRSDYDIQLGIVVDANNMAFMANISGSDTSDRHVGFTKRHKEGSYSVFDRTGIDAKTTRSIVNLAKDEKFDLSLSLRARLGVTGDTVDDYSLYKAHWKKMPGDPEAIIADFSELEPADRFIAAYSTAMTELGGVAQSDLFNLVQKIKDAGKYGFNTFESHSVNTADHFEKRRAAEAYGKVGKVDGIMKIDVSYGVEQKHTAYAMLSNKSIISLDIKTLGHSWQDYNDYKHVADLLNKFAEAHGLVYKSTAISGGNSRELRIAKGKVTTLEQSKIEELNKGDNKEGVDTLEFANGWKWERMSPETQARWSRKELGRGVRGQAWVLRDDNNNYRLVLTINNGTVARTFGATKTISVGGYPQDVASGAAMSKMPTRGIRRSRLLLPYIKTAMDKFNWKGSTTGNMAPQVVNREDISVLGTLNNTPDEYIRLPGKIEHLKNLVNSGFATRTKTGHMFKITDEGIGAFKRFKLIANENGFKPDGNRVTDQDMAVPIPPAHNFKIPKKKTSTIPKERDTRQVGAETKTQRALTIFSDYVKENDRIPTRGEFIKIMEKPPFNMNPKGAGTYYYNTKKKYAKLNECNIGILSQFLLIEPDAKYTSFSDMIFD